MRRRRGGCGGRWRPGHGAASMRRGAQRRSRRCRPRWRWPQGASAGGCLERTAPGVRRAGGLVPARRGSRVPAWRVLSRGGLIERDARASGVARYVRQRRSACRAGRGSGLGTGERRVPQTGSRWRLAVGTHALDQRERLEPSARRRAPGACGWPWFATPSRHAGRARPRPVSSKLNRPRRARPAAGLVWRSTASRKRPGARPSEPMIPTAA